MSIESRLYDRRECVVAAALRVAATDRYLDTVDPGPYDDAQRELDSDILNEVLEDWFNLKVQHVFGESTQKVAKLMKLGQRVEVIYQKNYAEGEQSVDSPEHFVAATTTEAELP